MKNSLQGTDKEKPGILDSQIEELFSDEDTFDLTEDMVLTKPPPFVKSTLFRYEENRQAKSTDFDPKTIFAPGGNLDTLDLARQTGEAEYDKELFGGPDEHFFDEKTVIAPLGDLDALESATTEKSLSVFMETETEPLTSPAHELREFDFVGPEDAEISISPETPQAFDVDLEAKTVLNIPPLPHLLTEDNSRGETFENEPGEDGGPVFDRDNPDYILQTDKSNGPFVLGDFSSERPMDSLIGELFKDSPSDMNSSEAVLELKQESQSPKAEDKPDDEESIFQLDAKTIIADFTFIKDSDTEETAVGDDEDAILELGSDAILDEEDDILEPETLDPNSETVENSDLDVNAGTIAMSEADLLPSKTEIPRSVAQAGQKKAEETLFLADLEEEEDPDEIIDLPESAARIEPIFEAISEPIEPDPENILTALDILGDISEEGGDRTGDTIGLTDLLEVKPQQGASPEDDLLTLLGMEARGEKTGLRPKSKTPEVSETAPSPDTNKAPVSAVSPPLSAEEENIFEDTEPTVLPSEPPLPGDVGKTHYFSVTPQQIEAALERVINRVFSERIEKTVKAVVEKAVEEEMKKFRETFIEDIAEGDDA